MDNIQSIDRLRVNLSRREAFHRRLRHSHEELCSRHARSLVMSLRMLFDAVSANEV